MKSEIDEDDGSGVTTIDEEVKVKEWAPAIFREIRELDKIALEEIEQSLDTDKNSSSVFKAKESAGKSGSFMFSSFDTRFIIKTMNTSEREVLMETLPEYLYHLK